MQLRPTCMDCPSQPTGIVPTAGPLVTTAQLGDSISVHKRKGRSWTMCYGPPHVATPCPVKFLRYLAQWIARQRSSVFQVVEKDDRVAPPGKNWPQAFYKRHPELKPRTLRPLDWARHKIYEKVEQWFLVIGKELHSPVILAENVFNMDETGILASVLAARKYLVGAADATQYRGAGVKRELVTAIECISAAGQCLHPLIIWPASTQRSTWTVHPTPGWHFACSSTGYTNRELVLAWYRTVFDPQTRASAHGRPRVLINDGFGPHECLEVMEFCHENHIVLCRLPSHTSHKLQPCDVGVFGPLKTAYREGVEALYRGGANTVGKQHFTLLYSQARRATLTPRNIRSAWAKAGLYPWNPDRVLRDLPRPLSQNSVGSDVVDTGLCDQPLATPVTAASFPLLRQTVEHGSQTLNDHQRRCLSKMANAAERAMTARDLLFKENLELFAQNNESRVRQSTGAGIVGRAKVMRYEDIEELRRQRAEREAAGTVQRGRKRKRSVEEHAQDDRSREEELAQARAEIEGACALWVSEYCSVF